jgi:excisionase family DNA binding protein
MSDLRAALNERFILDALLECTALEPGPPNQTTPEVQQVLQEPSKLQPLPPSLFATDEIPLTVQQAASYLGVSQQTVYLWVERKQIPHLRVMGRNIRF